MTVRFDRDESSLVDAGLEYTRLLPEGRQSRRKYLTSGASAIAFWAMVLVAFLCLFRLPAIALGTVASVGAVSWIVGYVYLRLRYRRNMEEYVRELREGASSARIFGPNEIRLESDGLRSIGPLTDILWRWTAITDIFETPGFVYFDLPDSQISIPRTAFVSLDTYTQFVQTARAYREGQPVVAAQPEASASWYRSKESADASRELRRD